MATMNRDRDVLINIANYLPEGEYQTLKTAFAAKFAAGDGAVASAVFDTIVDKQCKVNLKDINATLDYDGYTPNVILTEFLRLSKEPAPNKGSTDIKDDKGNVVLTVSHEGDVIKDLSILILIFVTRGAAASRILKKIQAQWVDILKLKFDFYKIDYSGKKKQALGPKEITLARLASVAPQFVVALMSANIGKVYVNIKKLSSAYGIEYPKCTLTQMFSGVVPRSGVGSSLLNHCYFYAFMFDRVINNKRNTTDFRAYINELVNNVDTANKSALYSDNYRRNVLIKCGLLQLISGKYFLTPMGAKIQQIGNENWNIIKSQADLSAATSAFLAALTTKIAATLAVVELDGSPVSTPPSPGASRKVLTGLAALMSDDEIHNLQVRHRLTTVEGAEDKIAEYQTCLEFAIEEYKENRTIIHLVNILTWCERMIDGEIPHNKIFQYINTDHHSLTEVQQFMDFFKALKTP